MSMNQSSLRELASEAIAYGESCLRDAGFSDTKKSQVAHLYTLSIFEQFHATLCLLDHGAGMHCACQIRCMLEYLTDLINVLSTPDYCLQLEKENAFSDDKVIKKFKDALAGEPPDEPMMQELAQLQAKIHARNQHARNQKKEQEQPRQKKIENAKQVELHPYYAFLCAMTHPNLTSLRARHQLLHGFLGYRLPPDPAIYLMMLTMAIQLLTLTIRRLPSFTDNDPAQVTTFADYVNTRINPQQGPQGI